MKDILVQHLSRHVDMVQLLALRGVAVLCLAAAAAVFLVVSGARPSFPLLAFPGRIPSYSTSSFLAKRANKQVAQRAYVIILYYCNIHFDWR
jgi:hypothetical protein